MRVRWPAALAAAALVTVSLVALTGAGQSASGTGSAARPSAADRQWVTSWTAAQTPPVPGAVSGCGLRSATVRDEVHLATGGDLVAVTLSAAAGHRLRVGRAAVAVRTHGRSVADHSRHLLTFGGRGSVTVPAGGSLRSDPVPLVVAAGSTLAVSVYLPGATGPLSGHPAAYATSYLAGGDEVLAREGSAYRSRIGSWLVVSRVLTLSPTATRVAVALGDSITDGTHSSWDANDRWPDRADARLRASGSSWAVVDAGIAGNRLTGQHSPGMGVSGLSRLGPDALSVTGARAIVLLEGINDIRFGHADSGDLVAAYRSVVTRAHAAGLPVIGVTLLPAAGSAGWSASRQRTWLQTNAAIRHAGIFDAVVDGAALLGGTGYRLRPAYDSGDHLHPDDAGYAVLGAAVARTLVTLL